MRYFIDTNVFLRHLLEDHPVLSVRARQIMGAIERGEIEAWTTDLVVAEVAFVLGSKRTYNLPPASIAEGIRGLLSLPHLRLANKRVHIRAATLFAEGTLDYADAFAAAMMFRRREPHAFSFDKDFDGMPGVLRHGELAAVER